MARDRLDGTKKYNLIYEVFTLPGRVILWLNYMNPKKGRIVRSARHARSPGMTLIYSIVFWSVVSFFVFLELNKPPPS
jgi:hypothetical protein